MSNPDKEEHRREVRRRQNRRYYLKNREKLRTSKRDRKKRLNRDPKKILQWAKEYARRNKLEFDIPIQIVEYQKGKPCFLCGQEMDIVRFVRNDPARGYFARNLLFTCEICYQIFYAVRQKGAIRTYHTCRVNEFLTHMQRIIDYVKTHPLQHLI
jgi:hypothetical protein